MSGLDPLARAGIVGADFDPVVAELRALAADAEALKALLATGDVVSAKVLASNGLSDLLDVLGKRVAASLPPNLRPGDTVILEVVGFDDDRILVKNLGVDVRESGVLPPIDDPVAPPNGALVDPDVPLGRLATPLPATPAAGAPPLAATPPAPAPPAPSEPAPAPPPSVFVAASIQRAATPASAGTAPSQPAPPPTTPAASLEARLAAARTTAAGPQPRPATAPGALPLRPTSPVAPPSTPPRAAGAPPLAPPVGTAGGAIASAVIRAAAQTRLRVPGAAGAAGPPVAPPVAPRAAAFLAPRAFDPGAFRADPARLVRAVDLPVTPSTLAFAKLALEQPQKLPVALRALEASLPQGSADPRVTTLRTIAAFVSDLDPLAPTFASQLTAYVSHVLEGSEPKLLTLATATADATPAANAAAQPAAAATSSAPSAPAPSSAHGATETPQAAPLTRAPDAVAATPPPPASALQLAAAKIIERTAALAHDLKTHVLSLLADPPAGATPQHASASANAAVALLANQSATLANAQADPSAIAFTLPLRVNGEPLNAHVRINRRAPQSSDALDADNFHIGFVLETQRLGTVAIDVQTVGRAVSVDVMTERELAARSFRDALAGLGDRLELLRYRVASLDANVMSRDAQ